MTNLVVSAVLLSDYYKIQTNTPAFQIYAHTAVINNARAIASAWHLDQEIISSNNITAFVATPTPSGIDGYIEFGNRYHFAYDFGLLTKFEDSQFHRSSAETSDVDTNDVIMVRWMRLTNFLSKSDAQKLAVASMKAIHVPGNFEKPEKTHQLTYDWKDERKYPLPYYGFEWSDGKQKYRMHISGVISNVVDCYSMGGLVRILSPTNYFEMLGLPAYPIFVKKVASKPPTYEVVLDTKNWHQP